MLITCFQLWRQKKSLVAINVKRIGRSKSLWPVRLTTKDTGLLSKWNRHDMCLPCVINQLDSSTIKSEQFFSKTTLNNPKHENCKLIFWPFLDLYVLHDSVYNIKSERFFSKTTLNNPKHENCKLIFWPFLNLYVLHDSVYNIIFEFPCITSLWYIINQKDATLALLCLLTTTSMLYMFRTPFASIIRSTISCNSSHRCLSWVGLE